MPCKYCGTKNRNSVSECAGIENILERQVRLKQVWQELQLNPGPLSQESTQLITESTSRSNTS